MQLAKTDGLRLPRDVANEAVTLLGKERCKPNFGNAGAVETFFGRVKMRLVARDPGLDADDARRRIASQMPTRLKVQRADVVLENSSTKAALAAQVASLVSKLREIA